MTALRRSVLCIAAASALFALPVRAEGSGSLVQAEAARAEAKGFYRAQDWPEALKKMQLAFSLGKRPEDLVWIADCYYRMGALESARKTLFEYLRDYPDDPGATDAFVRFTRIEEKLAEEAARSATQKKLAAAVNAPPAPDPPRLRRREWTWLAASASGVAALGGVLYGARASSSARDLRGALHDRPLIDQRRADTMADVHRANALFATAAVLGAGAAVLFVVRW